MKITILAALLLTLLSAAAQTIPTLTTGDAGLTNARTIYNAPLKLYSVTGFNGSTTNLYVQVFGTVTGATNGAVPLFSIPVPATNYYSLDFSYYGVNLDRCRVAISSNSTTLVATPTANVSIQAVFKAPQ